MIEDGLDTLAEKVKLKIDPKRKRLYIFIYSLSKKQKTNPIQGLVVCACQTKNPRSHGHARIQNR